MRLLNVDCRLLIALLIAPLITNQSTLNNQHSTIQVASPNGLLSFDLSRSTDARLTYTVKMGGDVVIEPSALGIIVDGKNLGDRVESLTKAGESVRIDERYPWLGVHSTAVNRCLATAASVTHSASRTAWIIEARACDDGIAFRYVVPGDARSARTVSETTSFRVPAGSVIWSHDFEGTLRRRSRPSRYRKRRFRPVGRHAADGEAARQRRLCVDCGVGPGRIRGDGAAR
jgi:hypothetical protein